MSAGAAFFGETAALTRRWFIQGRRNRAALVFGLFQPLLWLLLFGNMFQSIARGRAADFGTDDYLTFQAAGIVVLTVLSNALMGGTPFLFDRESGFLSKLLAAPIARSSLVLSRFFYMLVYTSGQVILIFAVAALMGVRIASGPAGALLALGYAALLTLGLTSLSIVLAFMLHSHAAFFIIIGFITTPLLFVSNALVPLDLMPPWMRVAALLNPLTHAITAIRSLIVTGYEPATLLRSLGALVLFDVLALAVSVRAFRRHLE